MSDKEEKKQDESEKPELNDEELGLVSGGVSDERCMICGVPYDKCRPELH